MNGEEINEHINYMGKTDKTKYFKKLSEDERKKNINYKIINTNRTIRVN
jgi:hypothetical protein